MRIVLALLDGAFDVHRVEAQQAEDRVAGLHPFILWRLISSTTPSKGAVITRRWMASSAASSSACLVKASNLASSWSWLAFSIASMAWSHSSLASFNFDFRHRLGSDAIGFDHLLIVRFGDVGLGFGIADFDVVLPAFVGARVGGTRRPSSASPARCRRSCR